jgi:lysyl-tRNA synthetase class 1
LAKAGSKPSGSSSPGEDGVFAFHDQHNLHYDLVHSHYFLSGAVANALREQWGIPHVAMFHTLAEAKNRDDRSIALSRASGWKTVGVPFKHMVVVLQIAGFDVARAFAILEQNGYRGLDKDAVASRFAYATRWLERFAPEDIKFALARELPPEARTLDGPQREFLRRLAARLAPEATGEAVHALVYDLAKEFPGVPPAKLFEAIYLALVGRARGPRAGAFIAFVGEEFAKKRFVEAAGTT